MSIHTVQDVIDAINAIHAIDSATDDIVDIHLNGFTINSDIIAVKSDIIAIKIINNGIDAMTIDNGHSDIDSVNIAIADAITENNNRAESATQIPTSYSREEEIKHMENMKKTVSYIKKNLKENLKENLREHLREDLEKNLREFIKQICSTMKEYRSRSNEFKEFKSVVISIQSNMCINAFFPDLDKLITSVLKEIEDYENGGM